MDKNFKIAPFFQSISVHEESHKDNEKMLASLISIFLSFTICLYCYSDIRDNEHDDDDLLMFLPTCLTDLISIPMHYRTE